MSQEDIDAYLARLDEPGQSTLQQLRQAILQVAPEAEEGLRLQSAGVQGARQDSCGIRRVQEPPQLPALQRLGTRRAR